MEKPVEPFSNSLFVFGCHVKEDEFFSKFDFNSKTFINLDIPQNFKCHNRSGILSDESNNKIYVAGGTEKNTLMTTNKFYQLDLQTMTAIKLPDMIKDKCSFALTMLDSKIYAIGGSKYDQNTKILTATSSCEMFDPEKAIWTSISSLNHPRQRHSSIIYNKNILVLGGVDKNKRPFRFTEQYTLKTNKWLISSFKLYSGFYFSEIVPIQNTSKFLVFGGIHKKDNTTILEYDIENDEVQSRWKTKYSNIGAKTFLLNPTTIVATRYGGIDSYLVLDLIDNSIKCEESAKKTSIFGHSYHFNSNPIKSIKLIPLSKNIKVQNFVKSLNINDFFGDSSNPFHISINPITFDIDCHGVNNRFRQKTTQFCLQINEKEIFCAGGSNDKISSKSFFYDFEQKKKKNLPKLLIKRRLFSGAKIGDYIYVIGGTKSRIIAEPMKSCERFSLVDNEWEKIEDMNYERTGHKVMVYNNTLLVFGGINLDHKFESSVEIFNFNKNRWEFIAYSPGKNLLDLEIVQVSKSEVLILKKMKMNTWMMELLDLDSGDLMNVIYYEPLLSTEFSFLFTILFQDYVIIFNYRQSDGLLDYWFFDRKTQKMNVLEDFLEEKKSFFKEKVEELERCFRDMTKSGFDVTRLQQITRCYREKFSDVI